MFQLRAVPDVFELVLDDRARELRSSDALGIIEIDLRPAHLEHLRPFVPFAERCLRGGVGNAGEEHDEQLARVGARREHGTALDDVCELGERAHDDLGMKLGLPLELLRDALHEPFAILEAAAKNYVAAL